MDIPEEFLCPICLKILWLPVTTPCGHNFCEKCLERQSTYRRSCPICRSPISLGRSTNFLLCEIIRNRFPDAIEAREKSEFFAEFESGQKDENEDELCSADRSTRRSSSPLFAVYVDREIPLFPGEFIVIEFEEPNTSNILNRVIQGSRKLGILYKSFNGGPYAANFSLASSSSSSQSPPGSLDECWIFGSCLKVNSFEIREATMSGRSSILNVSCSTESRFKIRQADIISEGEEVWVENFLLLKDVCLYPVGIDGAASSLLESVSRFCEDCMASQTLQNYLNSEGHNLFNSFPRSSAMSNSASSLLSAPREATRVASDACGSLIDENVLNGRNSAGVLDSETPVEGSFQLNNSSLRLNVPLAIEKSFSELLLLYSLEGNYILLAPSGFSNHREGASYPLPLDISFLGKAYRLLREMKERGVEEVGKRYLLTRQLAAISLMAMNSALSSCGTSSRRYFDDNLGSLPSLNAIPTSADLEKISYYLSRAAAELPEDSQKWFMLTDTTERLICVCDKLTGGFTLPMQYHHAEALNRYLHLDSFFFLGALVVILISLFIWRFMNSSSNYYNG